MTPQGRACNGVGKIATAVLILLSLAGLHFFYRSESRIDEIATFVKNKISLSAEPAASSENDLENQKRHFASKKESRLLEMKNAAKANKLADLQMHIVPQLACPTMVRVGRFGDGGKFVCNPWRVPQKNCVIYSLGVNGEVSFEIDLNEVTGKRCQLFCVDPGAQSLELFKPFQGHFFQAYMTGQASKKDQRTSIAEMMEKFNHSKVDIIKMDIESWEFDSLQGFFKTAQISQDHSSICQLLVEFHFTNGRLETWLEMFQELEAKGFRMFSKEANMYCPQCYEFSYMHLTCFEEYGLVKGATFATFFT